MYQSVIRWFPILHSICIESADSPPVPTPTTLACPLLAGTWSDVIGIYSVQETPAINPCDFIRYLLIYGGCHELPLPTRHPAPSPALLSSPFPSVTTLRYFNFSSVLCPSSLCDEFPPKPMIQIDACCTLIPYCVPSTYSIHVYLFSIAFYYACWY